MRIFVISIFALTTQSGCLSLHANVPEEAVRLHMAREEGVELAAICSHQGQRFSEGAVACMVDRRMTCGSTGSWVRDGDC